MHYTTLKGQYFENKNRRAIIAKSLSEAVRTSTMKKMPVELSAFWKNTKDTKWAMEIGVKFGESKIEKSQEWQTRYTENTRREVNPEEPLSGDWLTLQKTKKSLKGLM